MRRVAMRVVVPFDHTGLDMPVGVSDAPAGPQDSPPRGEPRHPGVVALSAATPSTAQRGRAHLRTFLHAADRHP